ncbi:hypothetical protein [uncultured Psychrobacter sp.]|uniref:hypothetical protein n=1 Tax=uncultured Psychrobacter sp. TaxID=259303 RepID=UPI003458125A
MYNSNISVDKNGNIVASTEYKGLVAFYLKKNNVVVEKKFYEKKSEYTFKDKFSSGIFSIRFFFKKDDNTIVKYETDLYLFNAKDISLEKVRGKVIKEKEDYKITYYDRNSNITFVTFNGTKTTKKTIPFGLSIAMVNNWNLISVAQDNDTQYQSLSLEEFHEAVKPVIADKDVYAYGASLGGYCTLYFGGCIDATIIAASPKNSAHPSIGRAKFKNLKFNHKSFGAIPATSKKVYIVYDSAIETDSKFINEYISLAYPHPELLPIEHGTHMVLQTMLKAGVLKLYVNSIVDKRYGYNISKYIRAKCKYSQEENKEAFDLLESIVKEKLEIH